ncbi:MAG: tetratricopeptide repeat protein [Gemmatimonadota bacterium]|nr:tetratricopeptide repeat protein [Gemmatimonadota bacterium]
MTRLVHELRRRKVLRVGALYVLGAWVALQGADLAFPGLGIPGEAIRYVWIGAIAGLPIVLLFGWRYDITPHGIRRTPASAEAAPVPLALRRSDYAILAALLLGSGLVLFQMTAEIRTLPSIVAPARADRAIPRNSIAVLPMENVTGDPDQEYFAAGMHDALTTALSMIGSLTVKASSSTNVYRNVVQPALQTGRELGAAHLVEGSVFRTGGRLRINVRLISTASEASIWSESYERPIEDVLTLQNELARTIAERIQVTLTPEERVRLASARAVNPEVYEVYLRGMYHLQQYTAGGIQTGLEHLYRAIELDPEDPLAYAGLAQGLSLIGHGANPPPDAFVRAREAAVRALAIDPLFPEAHAAMGQIQLYHDWDWDGAEASFRRALQLNPNHEFAHGHYGWLLALMGDMPGAIEHMARAQQIAPVTPIFTAWLGWLYWGDGQPERAVAEAQKSLEVNPSFPWGLYVLGGAYAAQERFDEAIATFERLRAIRPNLGDWGLGFTYAQTGRREQALEVTARLAESPGQKDLLMLGAIHASLGDVDEAMRWLEAAREAHVDWFPYICTDSGYDPFIERALETLRDDPRFRALIAPLKIPGA